MSMSSPSADGGRAGSFGQHHELTPVDRFGVWLSSRSIRRHVPSFAGKRIADVGCGFDASFARTVLGAAGHGGRP
jgi:2-polyprenyl-3-methyl-5-hydroxy-6-metoxy-1,4-benzoquinol methylase